MIFLRPLDLLDRCEGGVRNLGSPAAVNIYNTIEMAMSFLRSLEQTHLSTDPVFTELCSCFNAIHLHLWQESFKMDSKQKSKRIRIDLSF